MAKRLKISTRVVNYHIHKTLDKKTVRKPEGHAMTDATIEKRRNRAFGLYKRLRGENWWKVITCDEVLLRLDGQIQRSNEISIS